MDNNQRKNQTNVTNQMKIRTIIVAAVFIVVGFGALTINMFNIQILQYEKYKVEASNIQLRDTEISAKRGTIYDANMKVLAQSATVWTVFVSPAESDEEQHQLIADGLSTILEVDKEKILTKLKKTSSYYEVIKYKVDKPVADQVRTFCKENSISGVNLVEDYKRYYPYGNFAATVLGFCGTDNQGLAGLESYYNEELMGTKGRVISAKNGWGLDMGTEYEVINEAQDGYSLVTTIDETIQHYLEKRLALAAKTHNVQERAVGIVMDVKTGAILAMAVKPDFDPNDPYTLQDTELAATIAAITDDTQRNKAMSEARQAQWRNKAVNDLYEPGSVFKIVTASSALDSGACTLNSTFNCSGSVQVENRVMRCAQAGGHGHENFSQALINSCNPAFIAIGAAMGKDVFFDYFYSYGLSEKTGIDLPGEQNSIHYTNKTLNTVSLASCSFGQSNKITPIQMITAVATAVNGGQLVTPHVVSQLLSADGTAKDIAPPIRRQVISEDVSKTICSILQQNVTSGNGKNAYLAGYRVGGKSGTSQKLDTPQEDDYIASFVGIAPMDDPQVAVLVLLDTPNSASGYYGGTLSGPVVGALMGEILPYLGVDPVYSQAEEAMASVGVQSITGYSINDASVKLQRLGLKVKTVGNGSTVVSQFPASGTSVAKGSVVIAYTEAGESVMVTVPNLVGKSPTDAASTLLNAGLNIKHTGASITNSGVKVTAQSVNAGDKVPMGTIITVTNSAADVAD